MTPARASPAARPRCIAEGEGIRSPAPPSLRERGGRPRGSPLRFELAAFYEVVEEVGVGF